MPERSDRPMDPISAFAFALELKGVTEATFREATGFGSENEVIEYKQQGPKGVTVIHKIPGNEEELVADALSYVADGAKSAGRRIEDIDIWWLIGASIEPTLPAAIQSIKTHLAAAANATFRLGVRNNKGVPKEYEDKLEKLIHGYDYNEHEHVGQIRVGGAIGHAPRKPDLRAVLDERKAQRVGIVGHSQIAELDIHSHIPCDVRSCACAMCLCPVPCARCCAPRTAHEHCARAHMRTVSTSPSLCNPSETSPRRARRC